MTAADSTLVLPQHFSKMRLSFSALLIASLVSLSWIKTSAGTLLYQTGFEASEGYQTNQDLVGQQGWIGQGSGGNGLLTGFFPGKGQQAYLGFLPPNPGDQSLFVYHPINKNLPRAQFSVTMGVFDSGNTNYDDFYWSVFNRRGDQLVILDFDNYALKIFYYLEGATNRVDSGLQFTNGLAYPLTVNLDYAGNRWSAVFNGATLATNQPITTQGSPLDLGDIDAAWVVYDTHAPGDNFMVFDDYLLTASVPPPRLSLLGMLDGAATLRLSGQSDLAFALEVSSNLVDWTSLKTNVTTGGFFDYVDDAALGSSRRFYRGRWVP